MYICLHNIDFLVKKCYNIIVKKFFCYVPQVGTERTVNMNTRIKMIMNNVMAALNTFGVVFNTNCYSSIPLELSKEKVLEKEEKVVDFKSPTFDSDFETFREMPGYARVRGKSWCEDTEENTVIVQLSRLYFYTEEDWRNYANFCGFEDPVEAQYECGDPPSRYARLNVRVKGYDLDKFLEAVAKYCW